METKNQPVDTKTKPTPNRLRKDGKFLFAEKLARVNAVLEKTGVPNIAKEK